MKKLIKLLVFSGSLLLLVACGKVVPVAATAPAAAKASKDCADCPEMVVIPAGSFEMGGTGSDEKPVHRVTLRSFSMGKTEVRISRHRDR